jgi:hypothetical protein
MSPFGGLAGRPWIGHLQPTFRFESSGYALGVRSRFPAITAMAFAVAIAACSPGGASTFDPTAPCTVDARLPRAYPDLEVLIPATFQGRPPTRLDSGRNCTAQSLGLLASAGFPEVRFAGGLWELDSRSGVTLAVFAAPGLTASTVADFYEAGARSARNTENVTRTTPILNGQPAYQIDTLNDQSFQTVVVWQAPQPGIVRIVLVGSDVRETNGMAEHRDRVQRAEDAFEQS